jgi:hypothetical protein
LIYDEPGGAYFDSIHKLRDVLARSPPGTTAAGSWQIPSYLNMSTDKTDKQEFTHLETSGTPINKLDRALRFDASNCRRRILGNNITTIEQAHSHYQRFRSTRS